MWPRSFVSRYLRDIVVWKHLFFFSFFFRLFFLFFLFITACWSYVCLSITNVFAVLRGSRGLTSSHVKALTFGLCGAAESTRESCWYVIRDRPYCRALRPSRQMRPDVYLAALNPACVCHTATRTGELVRVRRTSAGFHPFMSAVDRTQDFPR